MGGTRIGAGIGAGAAGPDGSHRDRSSRAPDGWHGWNTDPGARAGGWVARPEPDRWHADLSWRLADWMGVLQTVWHADRLRAARGSGLGACGPDGWQHHVFARLTPGAPVTDSGIQPEEA